MVNKVKFNIMLYIKDIFKIKRFWNVNNNSKMMDFCFYKDSRNILGNLKRKKVGVIILIFNEVKFIFKCFKRKNKGYFM